MFLPHNFSIHFELKKLQYNPKLWWLTLEQKNVRYYNLCSMKNEILESKKRMKKAPSRLKNTSLVYFSITIVKLAKQDKTVPQPKATKYAPILKNKSHAEQNYSNKKMQKAMLVLLEEFGQNALIKTPLPRKSKKPALIAKTF